MRESGWNKVKSFKMLEWNIKIVRTAGEWDVMACSKGLQSGIEPVASAYGGACFTNWATGQPIFTLTIYDRGRYSFEIILIYREAVAQKVEWVVFLSTG